MVDRSSAGPTFDPMPKEARIYIAGHRGMVGAALQRCLARAGYEDLLSATHAELDLTDQAAVRAFFERERPDYVFLAAARGGGIGANNTYPADFIYDNLMIEANIINASFLTGVRRLLFLGSSCIYPKLASQPMDEGQLLTGTLEPTNEPYAVAKIAGIKLCESYNRQHGTDFRSVMPTNLYGPQDNFHLENSHVVPALIRKFHEAKLTGAKQLEVWGSGNPRREFLHVDDMADASLHVMQLSAGTYRHHTVPMLSHVNVGTGTDVTIRELAELVRGVVGIEADLVFDPSKPDGTPRKLLDTSLLERLGWRPAIGLREGLAGTYAWFLENEGSIRG